MQKLTKNFIITAMLVKGILILAVVIMVISCSQPQTMPPPQEIPPEPETRPADPYAKEMEEVLEELTKLVEEVETAIETETELLEYIPDPEDDLPTMRQEIREKLRQKILRHPEHPETPFTIQWQDAISKIKKLTQSIQEVLGEE